MSVEIYVLNYTAITEALVKQSVMTTFQPSVWIMQGLSDDLRWKVFECGSEMGWRMLMDDMPMITDPEFEDVKEIVLQKSRTAVRWKRYLMEQQDMELSVAIPVGQRHLPRHLQFLLHLQRLRY
jgi:hypothetical protein